MITVFESSHVVGSFVESLSEKKQTGLLYCLLRKNAKVGRNNLTHENAQKLQSQLKNERMMINMIVSI